jgi:hypothetical protein
MGLGNGWKTRLNPKPEMDWDWEEKDFSDPGT